MSMLRVSEGLWVQGLPYRIKGLNNQVESYKLAGHPVYDSTKTPGRCQSSGRLRALGFRNPR